MTVNQRGSGSKSLASSFKRAPLFHRFSHDGEKFLALDGLGHIVRDALF
jgi:hypothetical protein